MPSGNRNKIRITNKTNTRVAVEFVEFISVNVDANLA